MRQTRQPVLLPQAVLSVLRFCNEQRLQRWTVFGAMLAWGLGFGSRNFELINLKHTEVHLDRSGPAPVYVLTPKRKNTGRVDPIIPSRLPAVRVSEVESWAEVYLCPRFWAGRMLQDGCSPIERTHEEVFLNFGVSPPVPYTYATWRA